MAKTKWKLDPAHSELQFKVKHLMISTVTGYFRTFTVEVESGDDDLRNINSIVFTADLDSVDTNNPERDNHLRSADFFDAGRHRQAVFISDHYSMSGTEANITGQLTIRGVTRPVALKVDVGGVVKDPYGQVKAGFTLNGKLSRKEYGLVWNAVTEAGQIVVSDEIRIHGEIQLIKQP